MHNAVQQLDTLAAAYDASLAAATAAGTLSNETRRAVNRIVMLTERSLTRDDGLPRRTWFRHQIYAPGFYTGYGVKTLPAVREAIEERAWNEAADQIPHVAAVLTDLAATLERATELLTVAAP